LRQQQPKRFGEKKVKSDVVEFYFNSVGRFGMLIKGGQGQNKIAPN